MDAVFKAIDDPSRRTLLDRLFAEDGLTLGELCESLPEMTRFGVMSHLRVLEGAELVTTRKAGRRKHHYLNPVPIRLVHDRWIGKYTEPRVGAVAALKARLEEGSRPMPRPAHVYQVYIRSTPEEVWRAIVDGDVTVRYFYGTRVESTWEPGAEVRYRYPDGAVAAEGEVIAVEPPHRLEMTFQAKWDPELEAEGPVREVWLVEGNDGYTRLSVELWDVDPASRTYREFAGGLTFIVSGMKTLLETGDTLVTPASPT